MSRHQNSQKHQRNIPPSMSLNSLPTCPTRTPSLRLGHNIKENLEDTVERNMKNPRTRTHTSIILAKFWIWWGWTPVTQTCHRVWPLAGLHQPHRRQRECTPRCFYARCPSNLLRCLGTGSEDAGLHTWSYYVGTYFQTVSDVTFLCNF